MADSTMSKKKSCWLTDSANIPVPPSRDDFVMVGNLQKRRGRFGKMSQQRWKSRCFVLLRTGTLCYYEADAFDRINFCAPPRGILSLDEDVIVSRNTKPDGDYVGEMALTIQAGAQRWKLCSDVPGEVIRWEEAVLSMIKGPMTSARLAVHSMRTPGMRSSVRAIAADPVLQRMPTANPVGATTNGMPLAHKSIEAPSRQACQAGAGDAPIWDFACALTVVDVVCFLLYKHEVSVAVFFGALAVANFVVGSCVLRHTAPKVLDQPDRPDARVPLVHRDDVGPLKVTIKRRFPSRRDSHPFQAASDSGDITGGIPTASSTMSRYDGAPGSLSAPSHSWGNGVHTVFRMRGKGYMQDKIKVTPAESLYEMVGMDTFLTEARVDNMASEVDLESISQNLPRIHVPGIPPLLILNVQLPSAPPALMPSVEDGPGYQCVFYFRMKEATARALNEGTNCEGLRLWVAYCQHMGIDDDLHGRFKCVAVIANHERLGLPGFVTKYNGKPVLINRSGKWVRGGNYLENTINVHRFSYVAKKSLHSLKAIFKDMVLHLGFTIEGRSADELPETVLACSTLYYPQLDRAVEFDV